MIIIGEWKSRKEQIGEVIKSYSPHDMNPNYMDHPEVQKDRILIEYFSLEMEHTRAYQAISVKYAYYIGMSTDTKVKNITAYKKE